MFLDGPHFVEDMPDMAGNHKRNSPERDPSEKVYSLESKEIRPVERACSETVFRKKKAEKRKKH